MNILSRYLMHVNCSGDVPPQETVWFIIIHGLADHLLEMSWWHGVNQAQWEILEVTHHWLDWVSSSSIYSKTIAQEQKIQGMMAKTVHSAENPSGSVGSFLIWQQPHPIYLAEQLYISGAFCIE